MKRLVLLLMLFVAIGAKAQLQEGMYSVDRFIVTYNDGNTVSGTPSNSTLLIMGGSISVQFGNYPAVSLILSDEDTNGMQYTYTTTDGFTGFKSKMSAFKEGDDVVVVLDRGEGRKDTFICTYIGMPRG